MLRTTPPLLTTNRLALPSSPKRRPALLHKDPEPVTTATLPVAPVLVAKVPALQNTVPPLLTINWLPTPERPMFKLPAFVQIEPGPVTKARLLLVNGPLPISPLLFSTIPPLLINN